MLSVPASIFIAYAQATREECKEWTLVMKGTNTFVVPDETFKNPIKKGDPGFNSNPGTPPPIPTGHSAKDVEWKCSNKTVVSGSPKTDELSAQGTEYCIKAAEISAKYGGFTSLDYVSKDIQSSVKNFLTTELKDSMPKIKLSDIFPTSTLESPFLNDAGKFAKDLFTNMFTNELKGDIAKKADKITADLKKEFAGLAEEYVDKKVEEIAGSVLSQSVPVKESGKLLDETSVIKERTGDIIAEQKRAQAISDTRDKCQLLYQQTVSTIKRSLLYQFSTQITDWIVKDEKPQFIKNPGKFLEDTARLAVDRTISKIAPRLCEPFRLNVQIQIPTVDRQANPFYEQVTCTLDQVTSNIENFYNNFRDGGWVAYQEMWKPQNNYFGAMMMVEGELAAQQQAAFQAAQDDLNRGQGFRSEKRCTEWTIHKKVECPPPGPDGPVTASMRRALGITEMREDNCYKTEVFAGDISENGSPPPLPADSNDYYSCAKDEITTPATLTSDVSKRAQQTDFDYLSASDDIENFLGTIEDAIINKLVKSGVKGLRGLLKGLPEIKI